MAELWKYSSARAGYHMEDTSDVLGLSPLSVIGAVLGPVKLDNGYLLDGTDDFIEANGIITTAANDTKGTFPCWAKVNTTATNQDALFAVSNGTGALETYIAIIADYTGNVDRVNVVCVVDGVTQWDVHTPSSSLPQNDTYCVIVEHDGTQISRILIDNVPQTITRDITLLESVWMKGVITDATTKADTAAFGNMKINSVNTLILDGGLDEPWLFGDTWDTTDEGAYWNGGAGQIITEPSGGNKTMDTSSMGAMIDGNTLTKTKNLVV